MERGISEGASKKNLVVFLFGDVLGHSFKKCNVLVTTSSYAFWLRHVNFFYFNKYCAVPTIIKETGSGC